MSRSFTLVAISTLAFVAACSQVATTASAPPVDPAAIASSIRAGEVQWNADWAARDAVKIASHYSSEAVLMVPGIPVINGRDAVQAALTAGPLTDHNFSLTFHAEDVEVAASGDIAFSRGVYEEHDTNTRTHHVDVSTGSYVTVYRKQADGAWLAVADINTPEPAAGASPEPAHP